MAHQEPSEAMNELTETIRQGNLHLFRDQYHEHLQAFIDLFRDKYNLNSIQAKEYYKKASLIYVRMIQTATVPDPDVGFFDVLVSIAEMILNDGEVQSDHPLRDKERLQFIKYEISQLESIPDDIYAKQKTLDERCKKLIILIYFEKLPRAKCMEYLGLDDQDEFQKLKNECLSEIGISA